MVDATSKDQPFHAHGELGHTWNCRQLGVPAPVTTLVWRLEKKHRELKEMTCLYLDLRGYHRYHFQEHELWLLLLPDWMVAQQENWLVTYR